MKERIEYCIVVFDCATGSTIKELVFDNEHECTEALKSYNYYGSDTIQFYEDDDEGEVAVVRCTDYVTEI